MLYLVSSKMLLHLPNPFGSNKMWHKVNSLAVNIWVFFLLDWLPYNAKEPSLIYDLLIVREGNR